MAVNILIENKLAGDAAAEIDRENGVPVSYGGYELNVGPGNRHEPRDNGASGKNLKKTDSKNVPSLSSGSRLPPPSSSSPLPDHSRNAEYCTPVSCHGANANGQAKSFKIEQRMLSRKDPFGPICRAMNNDEEDVSDVPFSMQGLTVGQLASVDFHPIDDYGDYFCIGDSREHAGENFSMFYRVVAGAKDATTGKPINKIEKLNGYGKGRGKGHLAHSKGKGKGKGKGGKLKHARRAGRDSEVGYWGKNKYVDV